MRLGGNVLPILMTMSPTNDSLGVGHERLYGSYGINYRKFEMSQNLSRFLKPTPVLHNAHAPFSCEYCRFKSPLDIYILTQLMNCHTIFPDRAGWSVVYFYQSMSIGSYCWGIIFLLWIWWDWIPSCS